MEDDLLKSHIYSPYFDTQKFKKQLDLIKKASETAQKKIDYAKAHDDNILRAIEVVEDFLRNKHRLCYGGQAINAHLPKKYKFYDPETSIPDYDFFTPSQYTDIRLLTSQLRKEGFDEVSVREGMHEGTLKVYVNFIPVADITEIDKNLYRLLSKKEFRYDGISYLDANTLRMLMYLELSRPKGEVERWSKVYERLAKFNEFVTIKHCDEYKTQLNNVLTGDQVSYLFHFVIENKRIFAGAELITFLKNAFKNGSKIPKTANIDLLIGTKKPFIFLSPNAEEDAKLIRSELKFLSGNSEVTIRSIKSQGGDLIPNVKIITQGDKFVVFIIEESACHSYFNINIGESKVLRIASTDTLITLYFSLGLIDPKYFGFGSMECLANELIHLSIKARNNPSKFPFPFISIKCSGKQISLPSLIRAKVKRTTQRKNKIKGLLLSSNKMSNNKTIKNENKNKNN